MRKNRLIAGCATLLIALMLSGCTTPVPHAEGATAAPVYPRYTASYFDAFDTLITVIGYAPDETTFTAVTDAAHASFLRLHQLYDGYKAYPGINNLFVLNREAAKGPVTVDPDLMALLLFCRAQQPLTQGTVNVALGTVLQLWHTYREDGLADPEHAQLPPKAELQAASQHVNMEDVVLDEAACTVYYADPQLQLDLGAVAKGFAVERVAQEMLASPMPSFVISAGGNVRAGGPPLDGVRATWSIGIQDPKGNVFSTDPADTLESFYVADCSLVTSGTYQRYYVVDGQQYHHLIDPATLMPGLHFSSVTIITHDSGMADLLSTAAFLMPYDQSRALIDSLAGVEALWVLPDGRVEMTDGARRICKSGGASPKK